MLAVRKDAPNLIFAPSCNMILCDVGRDGFVEGYATGRSMIKEYDRLFAEAALDHGYLTDEQAGRALAHLAGLTAGTSFVDLVVGMRWITRNEDAEIAQILDAPAK